MVTIDEYKVNAIVIASHDYKESSKIIRVFTRELGRISILARGAKRAKSSLHNISSLFSCSSMVLAKRGDLYYIKEAVIKNANLALRKDIKSIYSAQLCLELVDKTLLEGQVNQDIYDMVEKFLESLPTSKNKTRLMSMFLIKFISMLGYRPHISSCSLCGKIEGPMGFSYHYGGLICLSHSISSISLEEGERKILNWMLFSRFEEADTPGLDFDDRKIFTILIDFILDKTEIKGLRVLKAYKTFM